MGVQWLHFIHTGKIIALAYPLMTRVPMPFTITITMQFMNQKCSLYDLMLARRLVQPHSLVTTNRVKPRIPSIEFVCVFAAWLIALLGNESGFWWWAVNSSNVTALWSMLYFEVYGKCLKHMSFGYGNQHSTCGNQPTLPPCILAVLLVWLSPRSLRTRLTPTA